MLPSRSSANDRKTSFKTPPASIRDPAHSQETRRKKALEEQKRRRAERFDSSRQLDFFADLTLGPSDDEDGAVDEDSEVVREGISSFAPMLSPTRISSANDTSGNPTSPRVVHDGTSPTKSKEKKKSKNKRKGKGQTAPKARTFPPVPGKWADKCMYAELLEMNEDFDLMAGDGVPEDIESGWVALTPVPVGKRCLAITHASAGSAGIIPNTTLRSRLLGKPLMKPFPSSLPPHTILDCILDENWKDSGILHILDIIKWKGQDIGDCETPFRLWWRDTRLSELPVFPLPALAPTAQVKSHPPPPYQFPYPASFIAVPYHTNTTLAHISNTLIPMTRAPRQVLVVVPASAMELTSMDTDAPRPTQVSQPHSTTAEIKSDGLLLYVSQAAYEPGTSPLSAWIPIHPYTDRVHQAGTTHTAEEDGPLDVFERLVKRKLEHHSGDAQMDMS